MDYVSLPSTASIIVHELQIFLVDGRNNLPDRYAYIKNIVDHLDRHDSRIFLLQLSEARWDDIPTVGGQRLGGTPLHALLHQGSIPVSHRDPLCQGPTY